MPGERKPARLRPEAQEPLPPFADAVRPARENGSTATPTEAVVLVAPIEDQGDDLDVLQVAPLPEFDQEILLPVSGLVRLSRRELDVIDHPAFQRLFNVYQLGQTHLVYRGATHSRGQHSVGTLHAASKMIDALQRNRSRRVPVGAGSNELEFSNQWQVGTALSAVEESFVRLGALLHDIGHLPAGHTIEDELGLRASHDTLVQMVHVLDRDMWYGERVEPLRRLVDRLYSPEAIAAGQLDEEDQALSATEIVLRLVAKDYAKAKATSGTSFRLSVCRDLLVNTICADILDYLYRDWWHLGKPRYFDERLLDYLNIQSRLDPNAETREVDHRLVINLRGGSRPRPDAVTAILDMLESRYQLAEIALFHRVKVSAAAMLERALAEYYDSFSSSDEADAAMNQLSESLLEVTDDGMLSVLHDALGALRPRGEQRRRRDGAMKLVRSLRVRELHTDRFTYYEENLQNKGTLVRERFAGGRDPDSPTETPVSKKLAARRRLLALRRLEADFDLDPGSIVMYCPPLEMNTKIAEVQILNDGHVHRLHTIDKQVAGGHLSAQQTRFERLWRISFSVEQDAVRRLKMEGKFELLRRTIEVGVLRLPDDELIREGMESLAEQLLRLENPERASWTLQLAHHRGSADEMEYPMGAPSLRSWELVER